MGKINEELAALYASRLEGLQKMYAELDEKGITDWVGPLLMHCWEEEYAASKKRLMVIGQETNGWGEYPLRNEADVAKAIGHYEWFELGKKDPTSLFWKQSWKLNTALNGMGHDKDFLWTNINKFGKKGSGRALGDVIQLEREHFNVLREELEIVKPDVCVFFTGPTEEYVSDVRAKLGDVHEEPFMDGEDTHWACRLVCDILPRASYRTYHPGFGNRHVERYQKILDAIVQDALKQ